MLSEGFALLLSRHDASPATGPEPLGLCRTSTLDGLQELVLGQPVSLGGVYQIDRQTHEESCTAKLGQSIKNKFRRAVTKDTPQLLLR